MKIELKGWTVEDRNGKVEVSLPGRSNFVIGGGRVDGGTLARDVFNALEDKFAKASGVTAWDVAAELERLLDVEKVGEITVSRGKNRRTEVNPRPEGFTFDPSSSVTRVTEDLREFLKPKDIVVHGYTVTKGCRVYQPDGKNTEPVAYKDGYYDCGDKVSNYVRRNTSTTATQADVVAKIKEYFEGPREVKGHRLHRWACCDQWFVREMGTGALIGHGHSRTGTSPAFKAAQKKFKDGEPSLPEVAEFIENYREPSWHCQFLTSERDDKDNVVIPFDDRHYIRLSLVTGKSSVHKTAEEAKRCE